MMPTISFRPVWFRVVLLLSGGVAMVLRTGLSYGAAQVYLRKVEDERRTNLLCEQLNYRVEVDT